MVLGHTRDLDLIAQRVKSVELYVNRFTYNTSMFAGATTRKAPELPDNVNLRQGAVLSDVGCLVCLGESSVDCGTIQFVSGARVMGDLNDVKRFVKGRKFSILNRWNDFICMELA